MSGTLGLTVVLDTPDKVGEARGGRCMISIDVRGRYSPEGGDCDMRVKGGFLDEGELDGGGCIEDDGGEEGMGVL